MSHFSPLQYSIGLITTMLLIFLFSQSQLDHRKHENTLIKILSLKEYDSRIKLQIAELQSGYKRNYGGLVATKTHINLALQDLSGSHSHSGLMLNRNTSLKLAELELAFKTKLDLIEFFKRENAVLRNSLHYLPKLIDQLSQAIDVNEDISSIDKNRIKVHLNTALVDVLKYNSQINSDVKNLRKRLNNHKDSLQIITPVNLQQDINKIFTHAKLIIKLQASISTHVESILSNNIAKTAQSLYNEFTQNFLQVEKRSNSYRLWLLLASLLLLTYLAVVFLKLQHTSKNLKQSLTDLEFHKQAIDEHSIVSITDVKGNILYANDKFCNISQYSKDELVGNNHRILRSHQHDDKFFNEMWRTISRGNNWHGVFANRAKDGSIYWVDSTIIPRLNEQGKPYQYIGIRTDITAQKRAEEQAKLLARFPAESPDPVIRFNAVGNLLYANPASKLILDHWNISTNEFLPEEWSIILKRCLTNNVREEHELKINDVYLSILFAPIFKEKYVNLYARNITDIKLAEKNLNYQATHDDLTDLCNRYAFELKLEESFKNTQLNKVNSILLYLDLDQFKIVNDTCGHVAGDELLRQISTIFSTVIRDSDTLARLGGDEFGIILNNCDTPHGVLIANSLLSVINEFRFLWKDNSFVIGASIGLVEITSQADSTVGLLGHADIACYAAKDAGRNQLKIYQQDYAISKRKDEMQWASIIPAALAENKFILYAQLIKPLNTNASTHSHYEILIRLKKDQGTLVPPGAFIPAAERYGLMNSIDLWVIDQSLKKIGEFNKLFPDTPLMIAINLSGQSIGNKQLVEYITTLFKKYTINASHITFEITETSAITNLSTAIKFIKKLKILGCKFALDDFGSGLSSFSYLKNLPVDFLKIDGAFIKDILDDPIDEAMVQSISQIGHVMNIKTIAEFVENPAIEQRLAQMKVDFVQGFGIEEPRPFDEIINDAKKRSLKITRQSSSANSN